jgi:thiol-disulfide isomerase/thioredoxin
VISSELKAAGDELGKVVVLAYLDGRLAMEYWSLEPTYELRLPPGDYKIKSYSFSRTGEVVRAVEVPAGAAALELEPFDLPMSRLRKLHGQPAPELNGAVAWKNSPPLRLANLRGKVVLLDFWGSWCGACIHRMPDLFELHERFHERGLVIIGVHVDSGGETPTVAALDEKLAADRKQVWKGRDIPYPVALFPDEAAPQLEAGDGHPARAHIAAEYGIRHWPTYVLIDREGRVVGPFTHSPEDVQRLEALLAAEPRP